MLTLLAALILSSSSSSSSTHAAVTGTAGALGRPPPTCCDMCSVTRHLRHMHHNLQRVGAIIHFMSGGRSRGVPTGKVWESDDRAADYIWRCSEIPFGALGLFTRRNLCLSTVFRCFTC